MLRSCIMMTLRTKRVKAMYSWEIDVLFKKHDYLISYPQLREIQESSCQLSRLTLKGYNEKLSYYHMETSDGYSWDFKMLNEGGV